MYTPKNKGSKHFCFPKEPLGSCLEHFENLKNVFVV